MTNADSSTRLLAVSDLHVAMADNRRLVEGLRASSEGDWLIVVGDVAELADDVAWGLRQLTERFAEVIWTPGNHELWTHPKDRVKLRGVARYEYLVDLCRSLGASTPEDPFLRWDGLGGPVVIAPVFSLYDYSFRPPGMTTQESLAWARAAGIVCADEFLLDPAPYPRLEEWCATRVEETERRLTALDPDVPVILAGHWPLVQEPTEVLYHPEFAQWCGTTRTADWHIRFRAATVVYGHLHIPRTTWYDGVRFEEVSIGYPREWQARGHPCGHLRQILPFPDEHDMAAVDAARRSGIA
jgi:3',5'-cyclic AMP phosphodiesterase CpdA